MRLKEIKLAGFKSFVDPTTVVLPGDRCAVVGPNGCGKSNIIDAVRWVMGESSARHLRAESISDVIFNGSSARAPMGVASIELVFDNRAGRVGGSLAEGKLAAYAEIAIRRQVTREGDSTYYLNGTRCRRRDIADVFLGTGFGPRSYSIIEQGMISALADAKPEELRGYLEEAAGVTKYKERRRETNNRIAHTVDNLARLTDLREELGRQLAHLQRQARAAERYRALKAEERARTAELLAIRLDATQQALDAKAAATASLEVAHAEALSARQAIDTALEASRAAHAKETDAVGEAQARFYDLGNAVATLEQAIDFDRKRKAGLTEERDALTARLSETRARLAADAEQVEGTQATLDAALPALADSKTRNAQAADQLASSERDEQARQSEREAHALRVGENDSEGRVQRSHIEHGERALADLRARLGNIGPQADAAPEDPNLAELTRAVGDSVRQVSALAGAVEANVEALAGAEREAAERGAAWERAREEALRAEARRDAVAATQAAALGRDSSSDAARRWLRGAGLGEAPRLGENLTVAAGWERAVEMVLGEDVQAIVVGDDEAFALHAAALGAATAEAGRTTLVKAGTAGPASGSVRAGKLGTPLAELVAGDVGGLLDGVYAAESLAAALAIRHELSPGESVITRAGAWLGADWMRVDQGLEADGVLRRAAELEALIANVAEAQAGLNGKTARLKAVRERVAELQQQRETLRTRHAEAAARLARVKNEHDVRRVRLDEAQALARRAAEERRDLQARIETQARAVDAAKQRCREIDAEAKRLATAGAAMRETHEQHATALTAARQNAVQARDEYHRRDAEARTLRASLDALAAAHARLREQRDELAARADRIAAAAAEIEAAAPQRQAALQAKLTDRRGAEARLGELRERLQAIDAEVAAAHAKRNDAERAADEVRSRLEDARVEHERQRAQRDHLDGQLAQTGVSLEDARRGLAAAAEDGVVADEVGWEQRLQALGNRIARLGPINLAAIDEFETQSERKRYLDSQHEDLEKALATLRGAIGRIDRVTRSRFKDTFNQVNEHLKTLFPKVFGGGRARLELTGEDWLDTGVALMAQPPGKRNASIHSLSGGEKAMTAVALIFSIFQINPSPVCMLDEVDAPLDDHNIGRFAALIRELSGDVQFVLVTHNKQTIEVADHLLGVTMQEAGVSRLVSVDVEQAAKMAVAG